MTPLSQIVAWLASRPGYTASYLQLKREFGDITGELRTLVDLDLIWGDFERFRLKEGLLSARTKRQSKYSASRRITKIREWQSRAA